MTVIPLFVPYYLQDWCCSESPFARQGYRNGLDTKTRESATECRCAAGRPLRNSNGPPDRSVWCGIEAVQSSANCFGCGVETVGGEYCDSELYSVVGTTPQGLSGQPSRTLHRCCRHLAHSQN